MGKVAGSSKSENGEIYHLLSRSLSQGVAIAQIINFNILDVITVRNVNFISRLG